MATVESRVGGGQQRSKTSCRQAPRQVTVQMLGGQCHRIALLLGRYRVSDLKCSIQETVGTPYNQQDLFLLFDDTDEESEQPLEDEFEIKEACTVLLCVKGEICYEFHRQNCSSDVDFTIVELDADCTVATLTGRSQVETLLAVPMGSPATFCMHKGVHSISLRLKPCGPIHFCCGAALVPLTKGEPYAYGSSTAKTNRPWRPWSKELCHNGHDMEGEDWVMGLFGLLLFETIYSVIKFLIVHVVFAGKFGFAVLLHFEVPMLMYVHEACERMLKRAICCAVAYRDAVLSACFTTHPPKSCGGCITLHNKLREDDYSPFCRRLQSGGGILTMEVDLDVGTMKFWMDGMPGPGYTCGITGPLRWAVSFEYGESESAVEIVPTPRELQPWDVGNWPRESDGGYWPTTRGHYHDGRGYFSDDLDD